MANPEAMCTTARSLPISWSRCKIRDLGHGIDVSLGELTITRHPARATWAQGCERRDSTARDPRLYCSRSNRTYAGTNLSSALGVHSALHYNQAWLPSVPRTPYCRQK